MSKQLTEYYERQFNHFIEHLESKGCTCASWMDEDVCEYCAHEGNMANLHDNEEAWEDVE
jgi:hypothetical protein